jgi:GNAT superfamily N-acetyltransferase
LPSRPGSGVEDFRVRRGRAEDAPLILQFIRDLAEYEGIAGRVSATEEGLRETLFGENPAAETALAFAGDEPAGFAVFFHTFSTILGKKGLHLDDLFVRPEWRGKGLGSTMLRWLASLALERGCGRFEWWCMKNNTGALDFYHRLGARTLDEVFVLRLEGEEISGLAGEIPAGASGC